MVIENIVQGIMNILIPILESILTIIQNLSGVWFYEAMLGLAIVLSYFLSKWDKFMDFVTGKIGSIVTLSILIFIIFYLIKINLGGI